MRVKTMFRGMICRNQRVVFRPKNFNIQNKVCHVMEFLYLGRMKLMREGGIRIKQMGVGKSKCGKVEVGKGVRKT